MFHRSKTILVHNGGDKPVMMCRPVNVKWIPQLSLGVRSTVGYLLERDPPIDINRIVTEKHINQLVAEAKARMPEVNARWEEMVLHRAEDDIFNRQKIITSTLDYGGAYVLEDTGSSVVFTPILREPSEIEKLSELWDCLSGEHKEPDFEVPF